MTSRPTVLPALAAESVAVSAAGTVTIGASGNAATARIEIQDSHTAPNTISFNGCNNTSVGLQNLSGTNDFQGSIVANVGGGSGLPCRRLKTCATRRRKRR